jgi:hypothetical protein
MPFKFTPAICMVLCALFAILGGAAIQFGLNPLGFGLHVAACISFVGAMVLYLNHPYS